VLATLIALTAIASSAIQLEANPLGEHYFRVVGGAHGTLAVFVDSSEPGVPAMLGESSRSGADLLFVPRFALQPGLRYRVEFTDQEKVTASFQIQPRVAAAGFVEQVYPSAQELPENQLKLYLHFATAMARGEIYHHLHLLDASGQVIQQPFLELAEELWDPQLRRLTVLFDPGRVKRDLVPNREVGTPLEAGGSYTLVVDAQLRDAAGQPLQRDYRKRFTVRAADRESPQPEQWRLESPAPGGRAALSLVFPEPLDHALLQHSISVQDASGKALAGAVSIDSEERRWRFRPTAAWQPGAYQLVIATSLEDLAGNRIGRLFDTDVSVPQAAALSATVTRSFRVR
jgi:hypothetical protein